jgi:hypothetical protein
VLAQQRLGLRRLGGVAGDKDAEMTARTGVVSSRGGRTREAELMNMPATVEAPTSTITRSDDRVQDPEGDGLSASDQGPVPDDQMAIQ